MGSPTGRLVLTHSTYLPGLVAILRRLVLQPGIQTVTPAVIGRAKSHTPKLRIRISVPTLGGYKLIARHGKTFQEVFVVTDLSQLDLEGAIATAIG
ncbi:DUF2103 domain-containing protein [Prochlorothrix hollandica]|uniref:Metal-binding protein n=1 Tax=Prochlorothrix hollandica PCC 9006 = CALU 1027 TaxID=317619 RepID=A0A0M2Q2W4_PROHO|nr:DUF2103 domain-containing protein [Prochlorothrix hollandica]KKJ00932.1 metal-binding protein [Prochlorothrix hollandica PCC 9006 = CALU 1027]